MGVPLTSIDSYSALVVLPNAATEVDRGARRLLAAVNQQAVSAEASSSGNEAQDLQIAAETVRLLSLQTQFEASLAVVARTSEMTDSLVRTLA